MAQAKRGRRWGLIALEVLVFLALFLGIRAYMQRDLASGEAPLLLGATVEGSALSLESYRGEPVLLHFWASWCRICRLEQDAIEAIARDWPVLTVAMQSGDGLEVERYLEEHGLSFTTIVDEHGALAQRFGVRGVPTSFVIDPAGRIVFSETGFTTGWGLRARLWWAGL
jgi:thiol-disulfide isomerase/thioredoxin